jgi:hypothetical protein
VLAVVGVVVTGRLASNGGVAAGPVRSHTSSQSLQGANSANVTVHLGAGNLDVGVLENQSGQLAQMTYDGPDQLTPEANYRVRNSQGQLMYSLHGGGPPWRLPFSNGGASSHMSLLLSPEVPLSLNIQEGASEGRIDLSQLRVNNLELQTGASHTTVVLPENAGATSASIKGGAATIEVEVPRDVAAQIQYEGGLSTLDVDQSRFPSTGPRSYRSPDYDSAANKVDLTVQVGVATISIR